MDDPSQEYVILPHIPTPSQYYSLRASARMFPPPASTIAASHALSNSFACFVAFERSSVTYYTANAPMPQQDPVGMTRIIGDGALFLQITDVVVNPEHQRKGIAKRMLKLAIDYIDENAPEAFVSLIADPPGVKLYEGLGFEDVGFEGKGPKGMFRCRRLQDRNAVENAGESEGGDTG